MSLGYANITLIQTDFGHTILAFKDSSFLDEAAELIEQPLTDFCSGNYKDKVGRKIMISPMESMYYTKGFIFPTDKEARVASKKIVEEVYRKH